MQCNKPEIERRRENRHSLTTCAFAVDSHFGQIIDISRNGLAFQYIERSPRSMAAIQHGVLFDDDDLCFDGVPVRTVFDCVVSSGISPFASIIRRRGVEFVNLSREQRQQLEHFIQSSISPRTKSSISW